MKREQIEEKTNARPCKDSRTLCGRTSTRVPVKELFVQSIFTHFYLLWSSHCSVRKDLLILTQEFTSKNSNREQTKALVLGLVWPLFLTPPPLFQLTPQYYAGIFGKKRLQFENLVGSSVTVCSRQKSSFCQSRESHKTAVANSIISILTHFAHRPIKGKLYTLHKSFIAF